MHPGHSSTHALTRGKRAYLVPARQQRKHTKLERGQLASHAAAEIAEEQRACALRWQQA
jgi:hypothetical protein